VLRTVNPNRTLRLDASRTRRIHAALLSNSDRQEPWDARCPSAQCHTGSMAIQITMTADQLGRSRFVVSQAQEVVSTLRVRGKHAARHASTWYARAQERMAPDALAVLNALVPADHEYSPDFLTPPPTRSVETIEDLTRRIAQTPPADIERQLDIGLRGRPIRPDVAQLFRDELTYDRWRRPTPAVLARVIADGPEKVASAAAEAISQFFAVAIEPDWRTTITVLEDDIRRKSELLAARGAVAMLDSLGQGMSWTGTGISLPRPYDVVVDWADDGLLMIPTTTHIGPVQFTTECPMTPVVVYRPDGTAQLWQTHTQVRQSAVADLVGDTRAALLAALGEPRTTTDLGRQYPWSEATISYHLQVLLRAGMVHRSRHGRKVLYRRTPLGTSLVET